MFRLLPICRCTTAAAAEGVWWRREQPRWPVAVPAADDTPIITIAIGRYSYIYRTWRKSGNTSIVATRTYNNRYRIWIDKGNTSITATGRYRNIYRKWKQAGIGMTS